MNRKIQNISEEILSLKRINAGTRSAFSEKDAIVCSEPLETNTSTNTVQSVASCPNLFEGESNGTSYYYIRVIKDTKKPSEISPKATQSRLKLHLLFLQPLTGLGVAMRRKKLRLLCHVLIVLFFLLSLL